MREKIYFAGGQLSIINIPFDLKNTEALTFFVFFSCLMKLYYVVAKLKNYRVPSSCKDVQYN